MRLVDEQRAQRFARFKTATEEILLSGAISLVFDTHDARNIVELVYKRAWESKMTFEHYGEARVWIYDRLLLLSNLLRKLRRQENDSGLYQPARDWLSVGQIYSRVGRSYKWVKARIESLPFPNEKRICRGGVFRCYPLAVIPELVRMSAESKGANGWITMGYMTQELGRSRLWIGSRLDQMNQPGEERANKANRVTRHWPPWVLPILKGLSNKYLERGDWLSAHSIAVILGKDYLWVRARLKGRTDGELRRIPGSGKIFIHYPPEIVDELRPEVNRLVEAGDWLTTCELSRRVGKSLTWVLNRIRGKRRQKRVAGNNRPEWHYPPEVLQDLIERRAEDARGQTPPA